MNTQSGRFSLRWNDVI